ncbi:hypothetical protein GCM10023260_05740 [Bartonella acomydis]|uniref:Aminoglycoside phosphotransferase domain-containing protein n=1 Tax=Bartonella acomydis TaxID=686234 RepID=A0ABP9MKC7_9HYPH
MMRDYHSPNILWRAHKEGFDRIGLIDFQDGLIGPTVYDLVSLAQDARVFISPTLEAKILDIYCNARYKEPKFFDESDFASFMLLRVLSALQKY